MVNGCYLLSAQINCCVPQAFRVDRHTFGVIVDLLRPHIAKQDTKFREAWPVELRVAIALYRLSTGSSCTKMQYVFGVSPTSCRETCVEVCKALFEHVKPQYVKIWSGTEMLVNMTAFLRDDDMPGCIGAIDGSHIPISKPPGSKNKYRSRKNFHSIILSALVSHDMSFMDCDIGFPGRAHDAKVYRKSQLFPKAQRHFDMNHRVVVDIPAGEKVFKPYILGDPAYPPGPFLIKVYPGVALTREQEYFN